ncbi:RICIN domain-containing protein [Streptomyces sp. SID11233]|nr:RICIN domain-containing protein [Streptomyces sp. SID11233]
MAATTGGYYHVLAVHRGKVLSVIASETEDGGKLVQWTDKDKPNQQFCLG